MGLFSKLKGAMNAVTGGAAKVTIAWGPEVVVPGEDVSVTVTVTSTGSAVKSDGVFVDVLAQETTVVAAEADGEETGDEIVPDVGPDFDEGMETEQQEEPELTPDTNTTFDETFRLCDAFVLGAGESREVKGVICLPAEVPPSSDVELGHHYRIRGRLEAFGNDPDSGYTKLVVGSGG